MRMKAGGKRRTKKESKAKRRGRRRGRGRGRGRRPDGEQSADDRSTDRRGATIGGPKRTDAERTRTRVAPPVRGEKMPEKSRTRKTISNDGLEEIVLDDDDADEMDLGMDGEDSADASGRGLPAGHKSIPSWDEAIGMIVDTNLATRTERRRSSPPSSHGSGPSRGRSRGGRRRKKS